MSLSKKGNFNVKISCIFTYSQISFIFAQIDSNTATRYLSCKIRPLWHVSHWAFMMAICFWEATFGYKSYHLSDCYQLYISCKNNIRKALNYQTDLSWWYQLYISCKINIETPITLSNRYETIRSIFL